MIISIKKFAEKKERRKTRSLYGADDEARTRYLNLGKVALYQMSYIRISFSDSCYYITLIWKCQEFFEKFWENYFAE